jgi:hypothetical protein
VHKRTGDEFEGFWKGNEKAKLPVKLNLARTENDT